MTPIPIAAILSWADSLKSLLRNFQKNAKYAAKGIQKRELLKKKKFLYINL